jgi:hypothetical protein
MNMPPRGLGGVGIVGRSGWIWDQLDSKAHTAGRFRCASCVSGRTLVPVFPSAKWRSAALRCPHGLVALSVFFVIGLRG